MLISLVTLINIIYVIWLNIISEMDPIYVTETIASDEDTDVYMNDGRSCADTKCLYYYIFINITGFKNSDASANSISDNAANNATEMEGENSDTFADAYLISDTEANDATEMEGWYY